MKKKKEQINTYNQINQLNVNQPMEYVSNLVKSKQIKIV